MGVPVLIGTNMLSFNFSEAVSSDQRLSSPWRMAMLSLTGQRKYEAKSGIVGFVKTTKPNGWWARDGGRFDTCWCWY